MSDQDLIAEAPIGTPRESVSAAATSDGTVAGGYGTQLAQARQRAGLGVTDVAASLRLHPNQVRAIEQEDLARLPELAYVRGFVRSYARLVGIDPAAMVSDLNAKVEPARSSIDDTASADYSAPRAPGRVPQWMSGIALVVLVTLGFIGWQEMRQDSQVQAPPTAPAPAAPATVAPTANTTAAATPSSAAATTALPAAAEPSPTPASTSTAADAAGAAAQTPTLLLRFSGPSWAEVTDARGKILISQLASAGTEHALDGELPLNVLIGDATKTSVEVRGEAFSLLPYMRNNVARFTVK